MTEEELAKLKDLARNHMAADLDMAEVAHQLVTALLAIRFPDLGNPDHSSLMCHSIATSLCGDPASMQSLKLFWNQLRDPDL